MVGGAVAHDAADAGNPVKTGGKATTSVSVHGSVVANNDRVDARYDIALRKNPDQALVFDDHDRADFPARHQLGGFANGGLRRSGDKCFSLHDISYPLTEHDNPGLASSLVSNMACASSRPPLDASWIRPAISRLPARGPSSKHVIGLSSSLI